MAYQKGDNIRKAGLTYKKSSGTEKAICPKCSHTRQNKNEKCLQIVHDKDFFNCYHCGFSSKDFKKDFAQKAYTMPKEVFKDLNTAVKAWFLTQRGITTQTLAEMNVTAKDNNTICFNYIKNQETLNIKYRNLALGKDKKMWLESGAELLFYNYDIGIAQNDTNTLIICEGEIDLLTFLQVGQKRVVSVPNGANEKGELRLEYLDACIDELDKFDLFIIATDNDNAGEHLANELIRRLGRERCARLLYPADCKDANKILTERGEDFTKDWLNESLFDNLKFYPIEGIETFVDYSDEIDLLYEKGLPDLANFHLGRFDELLALPYDFGQLIMVTGAPRAGKSAFVNELILRLMVFHGWKGAIFTPEHNPYQFYFPKLACPLVGKPFYEKKVENTTLLIPNKSVERMSVEEKNFVKKFLGENLHLISLKTSRQTTIDIILEKALQLVKRYGIRFLVIDPWNCVETALEKGESETMYVLKVLNKITAFCEVTKVHVFVVAHPTKPKTKKDGAFTVPTMYDIAGSAHFFNKTHIGISVYRPEGEEFTEVHIQKVKLEFQGIIGKADMRYDVPTYRWKDFYSVDGFDRLIEVLLNGKENYFERLKNEDIPPKSVSELQPF